MPLSKLALIRSTVLFILLGMAALLAIVGATLWLVGRTQAYSDAVLHARLERAALIDLRGLAQDAETGQRGYLLTGDPDYLKPYESAQARLQPQFDRVMALESEEPALKAPTERLLTILTGKFAELRQTIELYTSDRRNEALALVKTNRGRDLMEEARSLFDRLIENAELGVGRAVEEQQGSISDLRWITIFGALVIVAVVGGSAWTIVVYTRQLVAAQAEIQTLNVGLEARVREKTADLGRANAEIQRFAYIVTHDLRAPLVNIMGFTSELETSLGAIQAYVAQAKEPSDDPVAKEARLAATEDVPEALGFIRSSTRKMDGLINAILKLSRDGRRTLRPEPIELGALLEAAAASIHHQVIGAGGDVAIAGRMPAVVSDRLALEQIFGNLLDNAVKYREPRRPLAIRVQAAERPGHRVVIDVEDNGRGIAAQDHERVFDLFRRSGAQDQVGEGIGLAHVRAMVRNLGGDITLKSQLGQGTTFQIIIPRDLRTIVGAA